MRDARIFLQSLAEPRTVVDEHRAALRHAQVEFRQGIEQRWIFLAVAQDARFVFVRSVIVGEGLGVARAQLAERVVHESSSGRRAVADQQQILGAEIDRAEHVAQLAALFCRHFVDEDLSPPARGKGDLKQKLARAGKSVRPDRALALSEGDELLFRPCARRPCARQIDDRFEQICLALRVFADNDVAVRRKRNVQRVVIAEGLKLQRVNSHRRPSALRRRRPPCRRGGSSCRASCKPRR